MKPRSPNATWLVWGAHTLLCCEEALISLFRCGSESCCTRSRVVSSALSASSGPAPDGSCVSPAGFHFGTCSNSCPSSNSDPCRKLAVSQGFVVSLVSFNVWNFYLYRSQFQLKKNKPGEFAKYSLKCQCEKAGTVGERHLFFHF